MRQELDRAVNDSKRPKMLNPRTVMDTITVPPSEAIASLYYAAAYACGQISNTDYKPQTKPALIPMATGEFPVVSKTPKSIGAVLEDIQHERGRAYAVSKAPKFDDEMDWGPGGNFSRKIQTDHFKMYVFINNETELVTWKLNAASEKWFTAFRTIIERMPAVTYTVSDLTWQNHPLLGFAKISLPKKFNHEIARILHGDVDGCKKRFDQALCNSGLMSHYTQTHRTLTFNAKRWNTCYRLNVGMHGKEGVPEIVYLRQAPAPCNNRETTQCMKASTASATDEVSGTRTTDDI